MSCCTLALNFLEQTRLLEFIGKTYGEGFIRLDFAKYQQMYGNTMLLDKIQQLPMYTLVCVESKTTRIFRSMNPDENPPDYVEVIRTITDK